MVEETADAPKTSAKKTTSKKPAAKKSVTKKTKEDIIFKDKIGRIRDIQIQPNTGKLFFLSDEGSLWKMERKNKNQSF